MALAELDGPSVALALTRSPELRDQAASLLAYASETCHDPDATLDPAVLEQAADVLTRLAGSTRSRRLRIDASRAADVVGLLAGRTWAEGCKALGSVKPSRRPVVEGLGVRLSRTRPRAGEGAGAELSTQGREAASR